MSQSFEGGDKTKLEVDERHGQECDGRTLTVEAYYWVDGWDAIDCLMLLLFLFLGWTTRTPSTTRTPVE